MRFVVEHLLQPNKYLEETNISFYVLTFPRISFLYTLRNPEYLMTCIPKDYSFYKYVSSFTFSIL